jgi:hypothetical protein
MIDNFKQGICPHCKTEHPVDCSSFTIKGSPFPRQTYILWTCSQCGRTSPVWNWLDPESKVVAWLDKSLERIDAPLGYIGRRQ